MDHNALGRQFTAASLLRFTLPNIVMMVFLSMYTIIDGIFVSRFVGTLALSAMNMFYPLQSVSMAVGIMLATGGSALIARQLGMGKQETARKNFTFLVATATVTGVLFAVLGNWFLDPLLRLLGTSDAQFDLCRTYAGILLWFSPAFFLQTSFQTLFVTAGRPKLGLWVTVAGGLTNIVLDGVFMGPLNMGIAGAAIATVIGYCIPAAAGLLFFFRDRSGALYFTAFRPDWGALVKSCGNGASEMVSNMAAAVTTFLFNILFLRYWGENGVAAITIVLYFQFVFSAVFFGFSVGAAPVISYKFGAQDTDQLKKIVRFCMLFVAACSAGSYLLSRLVIGSCLAVFTDPSSQVFAITMKGFPLFAVSFLFMGFSIFVSAMFTALSDGVASAVISFARTLLFLIGMLLLLPYLCGENGIWLSVPAAELLGLAVTAVYFLWGRKKYQY